MKYIYTYTITKWKKSNLLDCLCPLYCVHGIIKNSLNCGFVSFLIPCRISFSMPSILCVCMCERFALVYSLLGLSYVFFAAVFEDTLKGCIQNTVNCINVCSGGLLHNVSFIKWGTKYLRFTKYYKIFTYILRLFMSIE